MFVALMGIMCTLGAFLLGCFLIFKEVVKHSTKEDNSKDKDN